MISKKTVLRSIQNQFRSGKIQRAKIMVNVDGNLYPVKTLCYMWMHDEHVGAWRLNLDSGFSYVDSDGEFKDLPEEFIDWRCSTLKYLLGKNEPLSTITLVRAWKDTNPHADDYLQGYILHGDVIDFDKDDWGVYLDGDTIVFGGKHAFDSKKDVSFTENDIISFGHDYHKLMKFCEGFKQVNDISNIDLTFKLDSHYTKDLVKIFNFFIDWGWQNELEVTIENRTEYNNELISIHVKSKH